MGCGCNKNKNSVGRGITARPGVTRGITSNNGNIVAAQKVRALSNPSSLASQPAQSGNLVTALTTESAKRKVQSLRREAILKSFGK